MNPRKPRRLKHEGRTASITVRMSAIDRQLFDEVARIRGVGVGPAMVICARPIAQQIIAEETGRCICRCDTQTALLRAQDAQAAQQQLAVA